MMEGVKLHLFNSGACRIKWNMFSNLINCSAYYPFYGLGLFHNTYITGILVNRCVMGFYWPVFVDILKCSMVIVIVSIIIIIIISSRAIDLRWGMSHMTMGLVLVSRRLSSKQCLRSIYMFFDIEKKHYLGSSLGMGLGFPFWNLQFPNDRFIE